MAKIFHVFNFVVADQYVAMYFTYMHIILLSVTYIYLAELPENVNEIIYG